MEVPRAFAVAALRVGRPGALPSRKTRVDGANRATDVELTGRALQAVDAP